MSTSTEETFIGRIKWFNNKKGFGFLSNCETNEDVFVHHTGIKLGEEALNSDVNIFKTVIEGEYVSYQKKMDNEQRSVAKNVTGIMGGPLLCENVNKKIFISNRHTEKHSEEGSSVRQSKRGSSSNSNVTQEEVNTVVSNSVGENQFDDLATE